ncbi:Z1 domain protein [Methanocella conradii HZ254]|uniref:Z1 domain protein n=1 Tax=Methanocella conradii (strain DSM 24694 / JCM 17849 / CGMCC 1.5162 / HZ254) TaxID=1041930 RepID=H8I441_METCZ|nr:Z1 domain-containing protein [Methanocella conradii]AFC99180.1 Z1 domain protein [Methanocella conradii HZ254]
MVGPIGIEPINQQDNWNINVETNEIRNLRMRYGNDVSDDDFQRVVETAVRIMSNFPNPQGPPRAVTGLALGKVQSGKTLSFTTLIALAASNQYRIIVVLAGTKKTLFKQTKERLERDLGINDPSVVNNILIFPNPKPRDIPSISRTLDTGRCALIVCMKNRSRITPVTRLLSSPELRDKSPVLIIDDEGDEASLNTAFREESQSPTYRSILELRRSVPKCAYVAYTATPQANLLLQQLDALHPEFCVLVHPGEGYCGGSVFFGDNISQYIRIIPDEHVEIIDEGEIAESLQEALALFLVGAAIRHSRRRNDKHSMLIHTSHRMEDHSRLYNALYQLHENWLSRIRLMDNDPGKQDLMQRFLAAYNDLATTVSNPPEWDMIREQLKFELNATCIWIFNSLERREDEPLFQLENNIVIGGNMLGRGVTIKNLSVTYITRRAEGETNADTMEQRARWFGYKRSYLDLCRVYMTRQLREDYIELLHHEDDFWDSLRRYSDYGLPVSQWPPLLRLYSDSLRPTRPNVANYRRLDVNAWTIMQPILDPDAAQNNLIAIDRFFHSHPPEPYTIGNVTHQIVRACPILNVVDELVKNIAPGADWDTELISEYLLRLLSNGRLMDIDVVLMSGPDNGFRVRNPRLGINGNADPINGKINPMEGHSTNREPNDPLYYPGDREITNGRPQLQVHKILYGGELRTCSLALHIPDIEEYNLPYYTRVNME